MTTLTKEELDIDTQEAPVDELKDTGIKVDGRSEEDANNRETSSN